MPGLTIATDVICGFPNESEADFDETLALMAHYRLPVVNISQFYPRPGAALKELHNIDDIDFLNYKLLQIRCGID